MHIRLGCNASIPQGLKNAGHNKNRVLIHVHNLTLLIWVLLVANSAKLHLTVTLSSKLAFADKLLYC